MDPLRSHGLASRCIATLPTFLCGAQGDVSNARPTAYKAVALPAELHGQTWCWGDWWESNPRIPRSQRGTFTAWLQSPLNRDRATVRLPRAAPDTARTDDPSASRQIRCSNVWSPLHDSNVPPQAPKASALPDELNGENWLPRLVSNQRHPH